MQKERKFMEEETHILGPFEEPCPSRDQKEHALASLGKYYSLRRHLRMIVTFTVMSWVPSRGKVATFAIPPSHPKL